MSIIKWFLILAIAALVLSIIAAVVMYKISTIHPTLIICIWILFIVGGLILYMLTVKQGEQLIEKNISASYDIDTETYNSKSFENGSAYAFYTSNGIVFSMDSTQLLESAPEKPETVEVYCCSYRSGYNWCFLGEQERVMYILK